MELLLDFGADPNMEDYKKNTPMKVGPPPPPHPSLPPSRARHAMPSNKAREGGGSRPVSAGAMTQARCCWRRVWQLACRANHLGIVNLLLDFNVPRDKQLLDGLTGEAK